MGHLHRESQPTPCHKKGQNGLAPARDSAPLVNFPWSIPDLRCFSYLGQLEAVRHCRPKWWVLSSNIFIERKEDLRPWEVNGEGGRCGERGVWGIGRYEVESKSHDADDADCDDVARMSRGGLRDGTIVSKRNKWWGGWGTSSCFNCEISRDLAIPAPADTFLKQEGLQLAEASFSDCKNIPKQQIITWIHVIEPQNRTEPLFCRRKALLARIAHHAKLQSTFCSFALGYFQHAHLQSLAALSQK